MRFSIILAVAAVAGFTSAQSCEKMNELLECVTPYASAVTECSLSDTDCICSAANGQIDCYAKFCPEMKFLGGDDVADVCGPNAGGNGGDDSKEKEPLASGSGDGKSLPDDNNDGDGKSLPDDNDDGDGKNLPDDNDDGDGKNLPDDNDDGDGKSLPDDNDDDDNAAGMLLAPVGGLLPALIAAAALL